MWSDTTGRATDKRIHILIGGKIIPTKVSGKIRSRTRRRSEVAPVVPVTVDGISYNNDIAI